jgi:hypothetical protein
MMSIFKLSFNQGWPIGLGSELIIRLRQVQLLYLGLQAVAFKQWTSSSGLQTIRDSQKNYFRGY